jgi:hypothetical protein
MHQRRRGHELLLPLFVIALFAVAIIFPGTFNRLFSWQRIVKVGWAIMPLEALYLIASYWAVLRWWQIVLILFPGVPLGCILWAIFVSVVRALCQTVANRSA